MRRHKMQTFDFEWPEGSQPFWSAQHTWKFGPALHAKAMLLSVKLRSQQLTREKRRRNLSTPSCYIGFKAHIYKFEVAVSPAVFNSHLSGTSPQQLAHGTCHHAPSSSSMETTAPRTSRRLHGP